MNNGNLLTSLLGMSNVNPAVTKASAAKARAESVEKFQQALEQVRPEVAARKPAARKESPPAEPVAPRPEPKNVQRNSLPEKRSAVEPVHKQDHAHEGTRQTAQKSQPLERDKGVDEAFVDNPGSSQSSNSEPAEPLAQTAASSETDATTTPDPVGLNSSLALGALVGDGLDAGIVLPENGLAAIDTLATDGAEGIQAGDLQLTEVGEAIISVGLQAAPSPLATQTPVGLADLANEGLSPLAATTQVALGQVASGLALNGVAMDAQALATQTSSGYLASALGDELSADGTDAQLDLNTESGTAEGENPDFLLLNSKAAQNKLAETAMTAATLDKNASAADATKPAAAITPAVEALTRLAEAQSPAARAFVVQTGVPVPLGTPQWSQAVGDKVLWLAAQNVSSAEIRLDPPELGPMQVKVSVNQDQASVSFTSPHPAVREALDQQLGRLREMFSEQGLHLLNVDVSDRSFAQQEREQKESAQSTSGSEGVDDELTPAAISQTISMRLVDHYA
jgi:flagellar hook-length control protein FliK